MSLPVAKKLLESLDNFFPHSDSRIKLSKSYVFTRRESSKLLESLDNSRCEKTKKVLFQTFKNIKGCQKPSWFITRQKTFGKFGQFFSAFRLSNKTFQKLRFYPPREFKKLLESLDNSGAKKPRRFYFKLSKT
jgi:hypothetical protein